MMTYREYTSSVSKGSSGSLRADQVFFTIGLCLWVFCRVIQTSDYITQVGSLLALGAYGTLVLCIFSKLFSEIKDDYNRWRCRVWCIYAASTSVCPSATSLSIR